MTAGEFWKQRFGEEAKRDSEKLAVAMMNLYAEYVAKKTFDYWSISAFNDIHFKDWWGKFIGGKKK